jgi:hypothetical protein
MRGKIKYHAQKLIEEFPEEPFLVSELGIQIPGATLRYLVDHDCLAPVGWGGHDNRYRIWKLTDRGKKLRRR